MLILDQSSPIKTLLSVGKGNTNGQNEKRFLVILPDNIAGNNFSHATLIEGIPPNSFETTTLEDLAKDVLDPDRREGLRVLEKSILAHLIVKIITQDKSGTLQHFRSLPLENSDVQEVLIDEFDEYLRCCDAGSFHTHLTDRVKGIEDPFVRKNSLKCTEAFKTLEQSLLKEVESLGPSVFLSRSHLLKKARGALSSSSRFTRIREVFIASISVFDASSLKLIVKLVEIGESPDNHFNVRIFQGRGSYEGLKDRLSKADLKFKEEGGRELPQSPSATAILEGDIDQIPDFIAAPERRREVEGVAKRIRKLLISGIHPSEILLVARDSGRYVDLVSEIFPAYGIACFVQTRRPYAHLCAYRFAKATLDLIAKVSESANLNWTDITDPLRLGFCLPGGGDSWPLKAKEFIYLEESLSVRQQMMGERSSRELLAWKDELRTLRWTHPRNLLTKFLNWIESKAKVSPTAPKDAKDFISKVLGAYMYQHSTWKKETTSPRLQNPGRFNITNLHPTWFATRIRNELNEFEEFLEDCIETMNISIDWHTIASTFGEVFGSRTYGLAEQDTSAVKMVDAGNTSFLKSKYLFLMGMRADEFPRECPKGIFLSEELRKFLDSPEEGEAAYLYLRGPRSDYDNEIDFLELSLITCLKEVTCSMAYLDERGHVQEWSAFIDMFTPEDDEKSRISPDNWLPTPATRNWRELAEESPQWVRQRLYCYHKNRRFPFTAPKIDKKGIEAIASTLDPSFFSRMLESRIRRYNSPSEKITVSHEEPWFSVFSLQNIVGSPIRAHEIDLHAHCPLQFYFFQFLFLWNVHEIDRDTIPMYFKRAHWRLGRLPKRLSYVYPSNQTSERTAKVMDIWPDRQRDISSFQNQYELRDYLPSFLSEFDTSRFSAVMEDEWQLVRQEMRDNISRNWEWVPSGMKMKVEVDGDKEAEIILPDHRIDHLQECCLILAYVNFSRQIKRLFVGKQRNRLPDVVDPLKDYRLPMLLAYYADRGDVAGGIYIEFFRGERRGYYNHPWLMKHKGIRGYEEELRVPHNRFIKSREQVLNQHEWGKRLSQSKAAIIDRVKKMLPNPDAVFLASPSEEKCGRCVYNNLCQIPRVRGY